MIALYNKAALFALLAAPAAFAAPVKRELCWSGQGPIPDSLKSILNEPCPPPAQGSDAPASSSSSQAGTEPQSTQNGAAVPVTTFVAVTQTQIVSVPAPSDSVNNEGATNETPGAQNNQTNGNSTENNNNGQGGNGELPEWMMKIKEWIDGVVERQHSKSVNECGAFFYSTPGLNCQAVQDVLKISKEDFLKLNPTLNDACNMEVGKPYCIKPPGDSNLPDFGPNTNVTVVSLNQTLPFLFNNTLPYLLNNTVSSNDGSLPQVALNTSDFLNGTFPQISGSFDGTLPVNGTVPFLNGSLTFVNGSWPSYTGSFPFINGTAGSNTQVTVNASKLWPFLVNNSLPLNETLPFLLNSTLPLFNGSFFNGTLPALLNGSLPYDWTVPLNISSIEGVGPYNWSLPLAGLGQASQPSGDQQQQQPQQQQPASQEVPPPPQSQSQSSSQDQGQAQATNPSPQVETATVTTLAPPPPLPTNVPQAVRRRFGRFQERS